jgi:hypothetical protein
MQQILMDHSLAAALRSLAADPTGLLLKQWNWKTAALSGLWRAPLFAAIAARNGWRAAAGAGAAELLLQTTAAGFFGALAQTICRVRPHWHGLAALIAITIGIQHPLEFVVHRARGSPNPSAGVAISMSLSAISAAINANLMRRGWLIMGAAAE